ncbi:hypothetical protein PIB30_058334 [Stylosanthes scabra]|uniref:Uncharacterized protein n=1 Tax=Stylosanthes scabra TaxID=79078 RepID=A0ABU6YHC6_9FABA|nr:hypothetical protein [Stylosanthes scabra]
MGVSIIFDGHRIDELQNRRLQKLKVYGTKPVRKLFYKIPIGFVSEHVKYDLSIIKSDADLEVLFHCRRDFLKVRTMELNVKYEDVMVSSGGSAPQPIYVPMGAVSSSTPMELVIPPMVAPHQLRWT